MPKKITITIEQLTALVELAKQNVNLDIELLLKAAGLEKEDKKEFEGFPPKQKKRRKEHEWKTWTDDHIKELIFLYGSTNLSLKEIGERIGRSRSAVSQRLSSLRKDGRIKSKRTSTNRTYSNKENDFIESTLSVYGEPKNVPDSVVLSLSESLSRTPSAIMTRLYKMQEQKSSSEQQSHS